MPLGDNILRECPSCGDPCSESARFCQYCGYPLRSDSAPELVEITLPKVGASAQTQCTCSSRHLNSNEARFCQYCGYPLFSQGHWASALVLAEGEAIVQSWEGIYARQLQATETAFGTRHVVNASGDESGFFVLTNQRIVWIERRPSLTDDYRISLTIPLENIIDVSISNDRTAFVTIIESQGPHLFRIYVPLVTEVASSDFPSNETIPVFIEQKEFPAFKWTVTNQVNRRKEVLETARLKDRVQVVLDFSFLKQYMEKGGLILQKITCTNCGGRMKLPETGNTTECPYCHTSYRVEDVFERVKKLMG